MRNESKLSQFEYFKEKDAKTNFEFYDIYSIFKANGIIATVELRDVLIQNFDRPGFNFGAEMTNGFLSQRQLFEDDLMVLRFGDFERIFIFDRQEYQFAGEYE